MSIAYLIRSASAVRCVTSACAGTRASIRRVTVTSTSGVSAVRCITVTSARAASAGRRVAATRGLLPSLILPGIRLPCLHRVAARGSSVLVSGVAVRVRRSPAVLRIVLPGVIARVASIYVVSVPIDVVDVLSVTVVDEVVVVIDIDVVAAAPPAVVAPAAAPRRTHRDSHTERDRHARRVITWWRISDWGIGIHRRAVYYDRVIARHVNNLRVCLLNHDDLFALDDLGLHLLLF